MQKFTLEEIQEAREDYGGFCVDCGEEHSGVEPDARNYKCENCSNNSVFGAEEIVMMGLVE